MSAADQPGVPPPPTDITPAPTPTSGPAAPAHDTITDKPPAPPDEIRLPPPRPQPLSPEALATRLAVFDAVLVALVVALAGLLAATPVRNTDLLMHLATGRALVEGRYNPLAQADPFAYTTEGERWVNHSWLYDLVSY